eukprot:COSAG01_NODE_3377_length_6172_cov_134.808003_5_plen_125_part_00
MRTRLTEIGPGLDSARAHRASAGGLTATAVQQRQQDDRGARRGLEMPRLACSMAAMAGGAPAAAAWETLRPPPARRQPWQPCVSQPTESYDRRTEAPDRGRCGLLIGRSVKCHSCAAAACITGL